MTVPPTESGEGDPGQVTRIAEEFVRLHEAGQLTDLDEFCARYPEDQRNDVRMECEQLLRIRGVIKQHDKLTVGQTLGSYEILEPIGKGGMGEVYRARDPELDRDIAIKVLPPELACQPERVKRFKREAKAIAALDHPNIVTIHSVEESEGRHFITMQLVQGGTLSELIPNKGLALEKFFDLAIQLADAISSAHGQGITHRDLKPANIMVTGDGRVEVLDFGLAKLTQEVSPERTTNLRLSSLTEEGQIVGTMAYMSPEQAEGRDVDHRTDVFSLGIILYEMATGERPFKGQTRVALMSSIMKDTPIGVRGLKSQVPNHLDRIIRRMLEKDPDRRFQSSKDLRNELEDLKRELSSEIEAGWVRGRSDRTRTVPRWVAVGLSCALLLSSSIAVVAILGLGPWNSVSASTESFAYMETISAEEAVINTYQPLLDVSPDGRHVAYLTSSGLRIRNINNDEAKLLEGTQGALTPFFSQDGEWIGFTLGGSLRRMPVDGGPIVEIVDGDAGYGASAWGEWVYFAQGGVSRVSVRGGGLEQVTNDGYWPQVLPGGEQLLLTVLGPDGDWAGASVVIQRIDGPDRWIVEEEATFGRYVPTGHVVVTKSDGTVLAIPYDLDSHEVKDTPLPVLEDVRINSWGGGAQLAISQSGTIAYVTGGRIGGYQLVRRDRDTSRALYTSEPAPYASTPLFSPDDSAFVVTIRGLNDDVYVNHFESGNSVRASFHPAEDETPVWNVDGSEIAFSGNREGRRTILVRRADMSDEEHTLHESGGHIHLSQWREGELLYHERRASLTLMVPGEADLWVMPEDGGQPRMIVESASRGTVSPDGRWIAYESDSEGAEGIWVRSYGDVLGVPWEVSEGRRPMWSRDRDAVELFYLSEGQLMVLPVENASSFTQGQPQKVFETNAEYFDVDSKAETFLLMEPNPLAAVRQIHVEVNWAQDKLQK